jgi:hypothetical protein
MMMVRQTAAFIAIPAASFGINAVVIMLDLIAAIMMTTAAPATVTTISSALIAMTAMGIMIPITTRRVLAEMMMMDMSTMRMVIGFVWCRIGGLSHQYNGCRQKEFREAFHKKILKKT